MIVYRNMSSRKNRALPQHRGIASGGSVPSGFAKSPKKGGYPHGATAQPIERAVDLSKLKVAELKALAAERGLTGYSKLKKADLIAAIARASGE